MYQVLVAIDENEAEARSQARAIANLPKAKGNVHALLMHVFGQNPEGATVHRVAGVRAASKHLEEVGIEYTQIGEGGDPARSILEEANRRGVDLVCVAGRRRSPAGKALFGSVAQEVILNAEQPVLTTGMAATPSE